MTEKINNIVDNFVGDKSWVRPVVNGVHATSGEIIFCVASGGEDGTLIL